MAAAALIAFSPISKPNPNPSPNFNHNRCLLLHTPCALSSSPRRLHLARGFLSSDAKFRRSFAAVLASSFDESSSENSDIEVGKENDELKREANHAEEAWKETLESFKQEALKMKEMSEEAYEVYSKKALVVLKETSERLKIEADKAKQDLSVVAKQISEEGKVYLSTAAEKSPESVKDVVETFASSTDDLKEISAVRDFYIGIPYGALLSIGGFLSFMLTGSIPAIRFGVILGGTLLALSIASLRSWKSGKSSELFLKGQAVIATIIFLREWRLFCQKRLFSTSVMALISGAILAFYVYRIMMDGSSKGPTPERSSEN